MKKKKKWTIPTDKKIIGWFVSQGWDPAGSLDAWKDIFGFIWRLIKGIGKGIGKGIDDWEPPADAMKPNYQYCPHCGVQTNQAYFTGEHSEHCPYKNSNQIFPER